MHDASGSGCQTARITRPAQGSHAVLMAGQLRDLLERPGVPDPDRKVIVVVTETVTRSGSDEFPVGGPCACVGTAFVAAEGRPALAESRANPARVAEFAGLFPVVAVPDDRRIGSDDEKSTIRRPCAAFHVGSGDRVDVSALGSPDDQLFRSAANSHLTLVVRPRVTLALDVEVDAVAGAGTRD